MNILIIGDELKIYKQLEREQFNFPMKNPLPLDLIREIVQFSSKGES